MERVEISNNVEAIMCEGKVVQQRYLTATGTDFLITDEQLEGFLDINFKQLGLKRGENQDEDVSLISWYTQKKFLVAISMFTSMGMTTIDKPIVMPYISNIVNENSKRLSVQPSNFKGKLYPPQASLLKRMLEVEESPTPMTIGDKSYTFYGGLLNERLSFGKTFCIPALLCEKFSPLDSTHPRSIDINNANLIQTNLIVCGTKVAKEWKNNLTNFTSFNFQVIERANQLDVLNTSASKGEYPEVLVVKDGEISWKGKKAKALIYVLDILEGKCFLRTFYDDYDMLKLERDSSVPDSLFTWFVSGTDSNWSAPDIKFRYDLTKKGDLAPVQTPINMNSARTILDAIASIKCNREYSITEYKVPQIDSYHTTYVAPLLDDDGEFINPDDRFESLLRLIQKIVNNEPIDSEKNIFSDTSLLDGIKNIPYEYNRKTMKILVAMANKQDQEKIVARLNRNNIKAVRLTLANVDKFAREDTTVCVAGNLFGINMGFLSHIVINDDDFEDNECTQIIGRGQRLLRTQNLQVYFSKPDW